MRPTAPAEASDRPHCQSAPTRLTLLPTSGQFDPRSDPLWELRKPLICYGGLDFEGRPRPRDDPSPIPGKCHLPYRESATYLNQQIAAGRLIGDVLFWDGVDEQVSDSDRRKLDGTSVAGWAPRALRQFSPNAAELNLGGTG